MKDLIRKLTEAYGPSGYEQQVRALVRAEVEPVADSIEVDALGSLIVRKGTRQAGGKRIMLSAHIDELGVMVTLVDENGFARFTTIGGIYPQTLIGGRVRFLNGTAGVIYAEPSPEPDHTGRFDKMYIDTGATSRENSPVRVGDVAAFDRVFIDLGKRYVSKAMDDRVSVAVLIEALKRVQSTPNELVFVFSVQEEVGLRGAHTAAYGVDPEIGIAVDVTDTGDTPRANTMAVRLGGGPAVKVMDYDVIVDPRLIEWMENSAKKAGITVQREILMYGGTDAGAINQTRAGVPSICLSIPTRYIHSPSEMVDAQDVEDSVRLLVEMLSNPVPLEAL